jgi:membrane protein YqaA with SNARE-associated domain
MESQLPTTSSTSLPKPEVWWRREHVRRGLGIALIVAITAGSFWLAFNPAWVSNLGGWGYVGAFLISLAASATVVLPAPGLAVVIAMGAALDPVLLGVIAGIGSAIGELTGYFAGATGSALIPAEHRERVARLQTLTQRYGALLLVVLSAIPFPFFDFAGIVAGILKMRIWTFLAAVAVGKSIKYVILILVGAGSLEILQRWLS